MSFFRVDHSNPYRFTMVLQSTAGVEFVGHLMRYAEVEYDGNTHKLLRLGNCEFEFDAAQTVYSGAFPGRIGTIQNALKDVFKDTTSSSFRFVLPSSALTHFDSTIVAGASDGSIKGQIGFETHLLNGGEKEGDVFPGEAFSTGNPLVKGYAVHHLSQPISDRIKTLCEIFPSQTKGHIPSVNASLRSFRRMVDSGAISAPNALLIGCYPDHSDYVVFRNGVPVKTASRFTPSSADRVYFCHESLHRMPKSGLPEIDVWIYGHVVGPELLDLLRKDFGSNVRVLNPGSLVNLDQNRFEAGFPMEAFVPCLGASIS